MLENAIEPFHTHMDQLIKNIKQYSDLSKDSLEVLLPLFSKMEYRKGDEIIRYGKPCQSLFLIEQGFCRAYNIQDGEEVNFEFFFEYETVTNKNSYLFNKPSDFTVVACEPMIAYKVDKADLLDVIKKYPLLEIAGKNGLKTKNPRRKNEIRKQMRKFPISNRQYPL